MLSMEVSTLSSAQSFMEAADGSDAEGAAAKVATSEMMLMWQIVRFVAVYAHFLLDTLSCTASTSSSLGTTLTEANKAKVIAD